MARREINWAGWRWTIAIAAIGVAASIALLVHFQRVTARRTQGLVSLSDAEKAPLEARTSGGQTRMVHPTLGFSFLHPGVQFDESPESVKLVREGFDKDDSSQFYAYADKAGGLLLISVTKRDEIDQATFEDMVDGIEDGFVQRTANRIGDGIDVDVVRDVVAWNEHRAEFHAVLAGKDHVRLASWTGSFGTKHDFLVMMIAVTPRVDMLERVLASYRPASD